MTQLTTSRLKLIVESEDELIDPFAPNWTILDKFAGGVIVADGVTPADADLFDGCIVQEATSGKSWMAVKNPISGVYTKSWLTFPWMAAAYTASVAVGTVSPGTFTNYPLTVWDAPKAINSDSSVLTGGQLMPPMSGLYSVFLQVRWQTSDSSDSFRAACIRVNNNNTRAYWNEDVQHTNGNLVTNMCTDNLRLTNATPIGFNVWQNSGANKNMVASLIMQMVCPL